MSMADFFIVSAVVTFFIIFILWMCKKKKYVAPIGMMTLLAAVTIFYFGFKVSLITDKVIVELGNLVGDKPEDYLTGMSWALPYTDMDISSVEEDRVGSYEVKIQHGWQHFVCNVIIQDTTAPVLTLKKGTVCIERGKNYSAEAFVEEAYDISGDVSFILSSDGNMSGGAEIEYDACGSYPITVYATDINGNTASKSMSVIVDTAPQFGKMPEYYLATGSEVNYLAYVSAYDDVDGDVTGKITVDISALEKDKAGDYEITYYVTDAYGLTSEKSNTIHIYEPLELQELINKHRINRFDQIIVGAPNVYDGGVYAEGNMAETLNKIEPAIVRLRYDYPNGGYSFGSGFIMEMNDKEIIICTNAHVVHNYKNMDVHFHDGTTVVGTVIDKVGKSCTEDDIAFVRVLRSDLTEKFFNTLQTIHIDEGIWTALANKNNGVTIGFRAINEDGAIWVERTGDMMEKEEYVHSNSTGKSWGHLTALGFKLINGTSGSAIVDEHGNLMAMATMSMRYSDRPETYYGVNLEHILAAYEKVLGRKPNYR